MLHSSDLGLTEFKNDGAVSGPAQTPEVLHVQQCKAVMIHVDHLQELLRPGEARAPMLENLEAACWPAGGTRNPPICLLPIQVYSREWLQARPVVSL